MENKKSTAQELLCSENDLQPNFNKTPIINDKSLEVHDWMSEFSEKGSSGKSEVTDAESGFDSANSKDLYSPREFQTSIENEAGCSETKVSIYKTPKSRTSTVPENVVHDLETTPKKIRATPLPLLNWADNEEVWQNIVYKEEAALKLRNYKVFDDRSTYLPRMRAILLDWIMEVCEVYHLRRNTYYLAVDYIDRYLTIKPTVPKTQLQLLGVSCLFIAAKLEEIYPPKLSEFSYVCDGACTENEILTCEILLLNTLIWEVNPMTATGWLNLYMQIHHNANELKTSKLQLHVDSTFQYPQYSGYQFVRASHVMDLFSMDPGFLRFSYSVIAAGAIHFIYGKAVALAVSGLKWKQLKPCVNYMSVFCRIVQESFDPRLSSVMPDIEDDRLMCTLRFIKKHVPKLINDENHLIQTHLIDLDYFEKSVILRLDMSGLRVNKVYVKKVRSESGGTEYQSTAEECAEKGSSVVMYELLHRCDSTTSDPTESPYESPLHPTHPDYEPGKVNIFTIKQKTTVTFDDILSSIHNDLPFGSLVKDQKLLVKRF